MGWDGGLLAESVELVDQGDDVDKAIVATCACAGGELVSRVTCENDTTAPAPVADDAFFETDEAGLSASVEGLFEGEFASGRKRNVSPSLNKIDLILLSVSHPIASRRIQLLIKTHDGRILTGKELCGRTRTVSFTGSARLDASELGRHAQPESSECGQEGLLVVDIVRACIFSESAHLVSNETVSAICSDDDGTLVGCSIFARDLDAGFAGDDVGDFLVGKDLALLKRSERVVEDFSEVVAADYTRKGSQTRAVRSRVSWEKR